MTTRGHSSTQNATIADGKTAVLRPTSVPRPPPPPDPDPTRAIKPDLTGLYEAIPQMEKWNSSRILQINQCGQALVGWLSRPPSFVVPIQEFSLNQGVFVAELRNKTKIGYPFFYKAVPPAEVALLNDADPSAALSPFDPWPALNPPDDIVVGHIDFKQDADEGLIVTIHVDDGVLDFAQLTTSPRLSSSMIRSQEPHIRDYFRIYQQQYIPRSYLDTTKESGRTWKAALDLFTPDSALASLIRAYVNESDTTFPNHAQMSITLSRIAELLQFDWDGKSPNTQFHRRLLSLQLSRYAWQTLEIESHRPKCLAFSEWLAWIGVHERNEHGAAFPSGFQRLLAGDVVYKYDFKFSVEANFSGSSEALAGGIGWFSMSLTLYDGTRDFEQKDDDGNYLIFWKEGPTIRYSGAFMEGQAGLGSPPGLPKEISFISSTQFRPEDFHLAHFEMVAVNAGADIKWNVSTPFTKMGVKASIGGGTYWMFMRVRGETLQASFDKFEIVPTWKIDNKAKPNIGVKTWDFFKSAWKGEAKDIVGSTKLKDLFHLTAGPSVAAGLIVDQENFATWKTTPPKAVVRAVGSDGERRTRAAFEKDKCALDRECNGWSVRFLLETILATELAMFSGAPVVQFHGYASPEGPSEYNRVLSLSRAVALRQAVEDALGYNLRDELTDVYAHGELAAESSEGEGGRLHDPEADSEEWKAHEEEVATWPEWRRVELQVRGHFALQVMTVSSSDRT